MSKVREIHDPFTGKDVKINNDLVRRLRGEYACGPTLPNGEPEFGWRKFGQPSSINLEAADEIERLRLAAQPKSLDWKEPTSATNGCWMAKSVLGKYSVVCDDGWYACLEDGLKWEWDPPEDPRSYSGPHAAQQACQDHFERTIRSALQTVS